jgi:hypothetical protein
MRAQVIATHERRISWRLAVVLAIAGALVGALIK